jgi:hypothetical protein
VPNLAVYDIGHPKANDMGSVKQERRTERGITVQKIIIRSKFLTASIKSSEEMLKVRV